MGNAAAHDLEERVPDNFECESAKQLEKILNSQYKEDEPTELPITLDKNRKGKVTLAPGLARSLLQHLKYVSSGKGIKITPVESEFTTKQAADFLNVSREYLNKLLEEGDIPYTLQNRHRRIKIEDLLNYKVKRDQIRSESLDQLVEMGNRLPTDE